jgi:hypothetical protein
VIKGKKRQKLKGIRTLAHQKWRGCEKKESVMGFLNGENIPGNNTADLKYII